MAKAANAIPAGYSTVIPHLTIKNVPAAIDFYVQAFGAQEVARNVGPDGKIIHADLLINGSHVFFCEEMPSYNAFGPDSAKSAHATVHLFVADVDKAFQKAVDAGSKVVMPPMVMFWGDRYSRVIDPFGQPWSLATRVEDLTGEEIKVRQEEAMKQMKENCGAVAATAK